MSLLSGFINSGIDNYILRNVVTQTYANDTDPYNGNAYFCNVVCASVCFMNDLKHIHLHAIGEDFDKIHQLAQELYYQTEAQADRLAEMALEYNTNVPNFNLCAKYINWSPLVDTQFCYETAINSIMERLTVYICALEALRNCSVVSEDVKSELDDIIRNWKNELNYKLVRRSACTEQGTICTEGY